MNISKIQTNTNFYNNFQSKNDSEKHKKREFIDVLTENVKNPRDVKDCVAVPRGIFKAYLYLMAGSSIMMLANLLPQKWKGAKTATNVLGVSLNFISAIYFAKPFAVKDLSPTVNRDDYVGQKEHEDNK